MSSFRIRLEDAMLHGVREFMLSSAIDLLWLLRVKKPQAGHVGPYNHNVKQLKLNCGIGYDAHRNHWSGWQDGLPLDR
jgi:hypothetical protein